MIATHGECGAKWQQSGNKTGHCSGCHRTFSGVSVFDAHQRIIYGQNVCLGPSNLIDKNGRPRFRTFIDAAGCEVWRSAKDRPKNSWGD